MKTEKKVDNVLVSEIMTRHVDVVSPGDTIQDAVRMMVEGNLSTLPVVDGNSRCIGILSRKDLTEMFLQEDEGLVQAKDSEFLSLKWLQQSLDTSDVRLVKELMTYDVTTIKAEQTVPEACREMVRQHIHHLPVVNDNEAVVGIVSAYDVVCAVAES